jgi:hypothetical protein
MADPHVESSIVCVWPGQGESVTSYCFGDASEDERYRFEAHLLECPYCWNEVRRLDAVIRAIGTNRATTRQFNGDVISMIGLSALFNRTFGGHWIHMIAAAVLYGLMLAVTVPMEIAYAYERYGSFVWRAMPLVFLFAVGTLCAALLVDLRVTRNGRNSGFVAALTVLVLTTGIHFVVMRPYLPDFPVTEAAFQTWTAQAAYLKGLVYCGAFAVIFCLVPFHFIVVMQRELKAGRHRMAIDLLTHTKLAVAPQGAPFVPWQMFGVLLICGAAFSVVSTAHLLEALKVTQHSNLFIQTIQIRWVLFLALGLECCWWYYSALNELKRECGAVARLSAPR